VPPVPFSLPRKSPTPEGPALGSDFPRCAVIAHRGASLLQPENTLEALRLASIQNEMGLLNNTLAGLEYVEFSDELKKHSFEVAVMQHVIPAWVRKVGGTDAEMVKVFNEKVSPIVGLYIEDDGSVTITKAR